MLMKVGLRWCIWFIIFFTIVICYCYNTCIYSHIALQTKSAQCKWPSQLLQSKPFKMMLLAFSIAYSILVKYRLINFHIVRIKISKIQKKQDTVKIYSILWWNQTLIIWNSCWFRHLDMVPALPITFYFEIVSPNSNSCLFYVQVKGPYTLQRFSQRFF